MDFIQLVNFIAYMIYLSLIVILYVKIPNFITSKILSGVFFSLMIWCFFVILSIDNSITKDIASLYLNLKSIGRYIISALLLLFIIVFTKNKDILKKRTILFLIFSLPLIVIIAQFSGKLSIPVKTLYGWRAEWTYSFWTYFYYSYNFLFSFYFIFTGLKSIKKTNNIKRKKQMKIIVHGGFLSFLTIIILEFILPKFLNIPAFPGTGSVLCLPWGIFIVYAMVKYRALDYDLETISTKIVETMFDNLILLNTNKKMISVNKATERSFGYSAEELNGFSLDVFMKNSNEFSVFMNQIERVDGFNNFETIFSTKDGRDVNVVISTSLIENKMKETEGFVCIVKDVTELRKKEKIKDVLLNISNASRKSKNLAELSEIVHHQVNLLMDAKNFYIALIHDEEQATFTFPYLVDINPDEYVEPGVVLELKSGLTNFVFKSKRPLLLNDSAAEIMLKEYGVDLVGIDSKSWLGVPLKVTDDKIIGVIALQSYTDKNKYSKEDLDVLSIISSTIANVIDHWQTEKILIQLEKMDVIGKLAGGVAHDLNNVLGAIVSYPDLIIKQLPIDSPLRRTVLTMQQSGLKAAAIVQDLLTLARRGVAINTVENLNDVIFDYFESPVFNKLKSFYPKVNIEMKLDESIPNIKGSSLHLSKTIMNLISNAAESISSKRGNIIISTELRHIKEEKKGYYHKILKGDYVVLTISDTGIGISKSDLSKIFEPFYTKKKMGRSGTGLGMAVVWGTIEDHNGFINVQSIEGKGTKFELYFPITGKKKISTKSETSIAEFSGNGEKILVIDDEETQREIATALLSELGYKVFTISKGEEAVEFLKNNSVDLCIIDMIMAPNIDGLDTYREILKYKQDIKTIIASGYSESERVKEALKLGANHYVQKPYTIKKMGMAIKRLMQV